MDGAAGREDYVAERLDHLGIVAGVCREIGLADYLDARDEHSHERIGVGTATVAMILNGLGFSNRRLYLVPQYFATKAVERLLGPGIGAEDLNDDCLGRTLDLQALDGNASDKVSLVAAVEALATQLRAADVEETPYFVADSGLYSAENVARLSAAGVCWISRVPDTSKGARSALAVPDDAWQQEGDLRWAADRLAPTGERWVVVRTTQGEERARLTLQRQVDKTRAQWEKACWHLGNQRFACAPDAQAALAQHLKKCPAWLRVQAHFVEHPKHGQPSRPRTGASPDHVEWQLETTLAVDEAAVAQAVRRQASFLVATNVLEHTQLSDLELIQTYKDQHSVERGFAFLKDPHFLASSVFVKKPERIVALALVMVLCLLVYRLAEHRLREQLAATGQTIPSQANKPTDRPTMRRVFQCFEGVDLLHIRHGPDPTIAVVLRLQPVHHPVLALLGPFYEEFYQPTN